MFVYKTIKVVYIIQKFNHTKDEYVKYLCQKSIKIVHDKGKK